MNLCILWDVEQGCGQFLRPHPRGQTKLSPSFPATSDSTGSLDRVLCQISSVPFLSSPHGRAGILLLKVPPSLRAAYGFFFFSMWFLK